MGRNKNFSNKRKKGFTKSKVNKKNKKPERYVNKKAIFNRYKDKQKVEEDLEKKRRQDMEILAKQREETESEEEEDPYDQLLACLYKKKPKVDIVSESESEDDQEENEDSNNMDITETEAKEGSDVEGDEDLEEEQSESEEEHEEESANESDQEEETDDPFTRHLQNDLSDEMLLSLTNDTPNVEHVSKEWPTLGTVNFSIPKPIQINITKTTPKLSILGEKTYAQTATVPNLITSVDLNKLHIKTQIQNNLVSANKKNLVKRDLELSTIMTPVQKEIFSILNNYQDFYYPQRTFTNAEEIRFTYCLHVVNHMLKTRTKILHHNAKLAKKPNSGEEYSDQGLVRPKVVIMVPFKDAAYRVVKTIIDILVPKEAGQVVNKNKFEEDFTGGGLVFPKKNPKPEDYELMFSGNTEDTFRIGMSLTKKTLKLYTDFYASDIIVASPLGLRMIVGAEGEEDRDFDFLASVELLIMDQADVFLMQNWDHLMHVLDHFHLQPRKTHGTDISRVRSWAANGWSKYYRQTIVFSSVDLPETRALLSIKCQNYAGRVQVNNPEPIGTIREVVVKIPHVFHRFTATSVVDSIDARFEFFIKKVLPRQRDPMLNHTLIYVPSYYDYVRLRNYFKKESISFVQICEYSKDDKIARARDMFFHTEAHFLLYSERVHFFRRFRIKGIRNIVFYQPPAYPHFYTEMCNLMVKWNQNKHGGSDINMSVSVIYSKFDALQLSAILDSQRTQAMLSSDKTVHMYQTGN